METIKVENIHMGQYKPYGDTFNVWKITTKEQDIEKIRKYCFEELCSKVLPEEAEWRKNIRSNNQEYDASYYFRGYYKLEPKEFEHQQKGYIFTVCEPYTD